MGGKLWEHNFHKIEMRETEDELGGARRGEVTMM